MTYESKQLTTHGVIFVLSESGMNRYTYALVKQLTCFTLN